MSTSETREFRYVATRNFRRCRSFSARHTFGDNTLTDHMTGDIMTGDTGSTTTGNIAGNIAGLGREKPTCHC